MKMSPEKSKEGSPLKVSPSNSNEYNSPNKSPRNNSNQRKYDDENIILEVEDRFESENSSRYEETI